LAADPSRRNLTAAELRTATAEWVGRGAASAGIAPVGVVTRRVLVEGQLRLGMAGQHAGALIGQGFQAEGLEILLGIQQGIHKAFQPLIGNHDRPGDALLISVHLAAEHAPHELLLHAVVAIAAVEAIAEFARDQQTAHEITGRGIAIAELHLEHQLAIHLARVEKIWR
jgi:hypothetical protein